MLAARHVSRQARSGICVAVARNCRAGCAQSVLLVRRASTTRPPRSIRATSSLGAAGDDAGAATTGADAGTAPRTYDAVVVGAGVVGLTLACRLASSPAFAGRSVAVVEANPPPSASPEELAAEAGVDLRVFAIAPASQRVFQELGVWDSMVGARSMAFDSMQVWDSRGHGFVRFDAKQLGVPQLGHIIENRVLASALYRRLLELQEEGRVDVLCPGSVKSLEVPKSGLASVSLEDGATLSTELVVAADGGNSRVKALSGVGSWGWDYDQRGLVCAIETSEAHTTAWQRFLSTGPLAMLPLWGNYSSIVWSTTAEHAKELAQLPADEFVDRLNHELTAAPPQADVPAFLQPLHQAAASVTRALGNAPASPGFRGAPHVVNVAGPRASFPLKFSHTNTYHKPRVAFIGDAAHTVHPLAGQGMNLGIADAAALAELLESGSEVGQDLGSPALLGEYGRQRKAHNLSMMLGLDAIKSVFAGDAGLWSDVRNLGMGVLNSVPFVKNEMAKFAMGMGFASSGPTAPKSRNQSPKAQ